MFTPSEKAKTWFLRVHNSCETGYQPALSRIGRPSGKKWIIGGIFKEIKRQGDKSKMNIVLKNFQWKCSFLYPLLSICFFGFHYLQNPLFKLVDTKTHIASPNIYPDKKKLHFQGFWANTSFLLSAPPLLRSLRKKELLDRISNFKRRQSFYLKKEMWPTIFFSLNCSHFAVAHLIFKSMYKLIMVKWLIKGIPLHFFFIFSFVDAWVFNSTLVCISPNTICP